jgi:hypothetical protein
MMNQFYSRCIVDFTDFTDFTDWSKPKSEVTDAGRYIFTLQIHDANCSKPRDHRL